MKLEVAFVQINDWVKIILDSLYDGVLIIDKDSIVKYINASYTRITNVAYDEIVGRPLELTRPGSRLQEVIRTGKKQLSVRRKVGDVEYVVNMVPIMEGKEIIGGISILNQIDDVYKLAEELEKSTRLIKNLRDRVKKLGRAKYTFEDIVYRDEKSSETIRMASKIAEKGMNVLITGESGTGKELYAQSIHNASDRKRQPFIAVNCATLDSNLLESELFGYEEGSFTGAKKGGKIGLFEEANGGTLFLDEISEMDYRLQAKLLRTLQENVVRPVGGTNEIPIDVRVIAATNKELEIMIEENKFRRDLYYRIAVFTLNLYPLRERKDDILPLIQTYLDELHGRYKKKIEITDETVKLMLNYDWPGNVRELKNMIEYAAMMTDDNVIRKENLPKRIQEEGIRNNLIDIKTLDEVVKETELNEIKKALIKYGDTVEGKKKVAEALGISLASLYNKLK
jgi:transcriptional regulator with PAS, ATPase and Fis domain